MVFLFCKFLYIILLCFIYGYALSRWLGSLLLKRQPLRYSFALTALIGMMGITGLTAILSLFMPMGALANGLLLAGALLCLLLYRAPLRQLAALYGQQARQASLPVKFFFAAAALYTLYLSSLQSFTCDEGLYYNQFIKWIQHYPVVPGLANLHSRFGFNSHWHVLSAVFNGSFLTGQSSNHLNGVLYLLVLLLMLRPVRRNESRLAVLLQLGLLVMINMPQVCVYNIVAPAADLVVYYFCCVIILLWVDNIVRVRDWFESQAGIFILLAPAYLVTVKVSAIPVLLVSAIIAVQLLRNRQYRQLTAMVAAGLVLVLPWLARNVILTGYLVFPLEKIDLFSFDWKVPREQVKALREIIAVAGYQRAQATPVLPTDTMLVKLGTWFRHNIHLYDQVLIICAVLSPIALLWRRRYLPAGFIALYAFLLAGLLFWLQAPDPRFGYGYLAPLAVLGAALAILPVPRLPLPRIAVLALGLTLLLQAGTLYLHGHLKKVFIGIDLIRESPRRSSWLMPIPYSPQELHTHTKPFACYTPVHLDLCWDAPLPCADKKPENVKMRGSGLEEGFAPEQ